MLSVLLNKTFPSVEVQDHSDSNGGNPRSPLHGLFFSSQLRIFYMHHPTDRTAHTTAVVIVDVENCLECLKLPTSEQTAVVIMLFVSVSERCFVLFLKTKKIRSLNDAS